MYKTEDGIHMAQDREQSEDPLNLIMQFLVL
jgi:hypothetical protein